eukprot:gene2522-3596_t
MPLKSSEIRVPMPFKSSGRCHVNIPVLYRGMRVRVSKHYKRGTVVPQCQFNSCSFDGEVALMFAGSAGTWLGMQGLSGAPIGFATPFPDEREELFPPGIATKVAYKVSDTLLGRCDSRLTL